MLKIHDRHLLIKTCSFLINGSMTFHFSQPYNKTDFTMLLKSQEFHSSKNVFLFPDSTQPNKSSVHLSNMSPDLLFCTISFCDNSSKIHERIHLFYICSIQCKFGFYTGVNSLSLVFMALIFSPAFFASSCSFAIFISITTGRWLLLIVTA